MTLCTCPWKRCRFVNGKQASLVNMRKHSVLGERTPSTWLCKAVVLALCEQRGAALSFLIVSIEQ